jgi:hypothetical protein
MQVLKYNIHSGADILTQKITCNTGHNYTSTTI